MNAQMQAAKESMSQWLAHPSELGKKPSKIAIFIRKKETAW